MATHLIDGTTAPPPTADDQGPARPGRLPGESGTWVLIFGDLVVFGAYFLVYLYARGRDPEGFAASQRALDPVIGVGYTILLLAGSLFVVGALRSARVGDRRLSSRLTLAAMGCGLAFIVVKAAEYTQKMNLGLTPSTTTFFTFFYALTAIHLFHVVLGVGALAMVNTLVRRPEITPRSTVWIESGCCFWHLVDLLWIVLFPLLYFVR